MLIDQPRDRQAVRKGNQIALHGGSGDDAFCALAPAPGPLSIAAGSVIVEVLVGLSLALSRRPPRPRPPEVTSCPCGFPPRKKKERKMVMTLLEIR